MRRFGLLAGLVVLVLGGLVGATPAHAAAPTLGRGLFAADTRFDTLDVGADTDNVPWDQTSSSALSAWNLDIHNSTAMDFAGAQIGVDSHTGTGLPEDGLANSNDFHFNYGPQAGQNPGSGTDCPTPSTYSETCPSPSQPIHPNSDLRVASSLDPQQGVPIPSWTTGYDSARQVSPPGNDGVSHVSVPITLRDANRYTPSNNVSNQIAVSTFNDNAVSGSASVTLGDPSGPQVPSCTGGPPAGACVQFVGSMPGGPCTSVFMNLQNAQLNETYSLNFEENEANASNCGTVNPGLRISAEPRPFPTVPSCTTGTDCAVTMTDPSFGSDPTLGKVTFSVSSDQHASFSTTADAEYVVQYGAERQLGTQAYNISPTEGMAFNGPVAIFVENTPTDPSKTGDYKPTIVWGDGTTSTGSVGTTTLQFEPQSFFIVYAVSGTHTYADEGNYPVTVTVTDNDTSWNTASGNASATVGDAQLSAPPNQVYAGPNPYSGPVAVFTDQNPGATAADFTAGGGSTTIDWGDGTPNSVGTVTATDGGSFTVSGSHAYAKVGQYQVTVTVLDDGGSTLTVTSFVEVGGVFVIGDQSAAINSKVNFWGSQWAKNNALSGGAAPNAFKGFASVAPGQPLCRATTWTTEPGNTSDPPTTIPGFMLVIVASHITKSGNTISGDVVHVDVVTTDPGYAGNPGHPGTGRVIFQLC